MYLSLPVFDWCSTKNCKRRLAWLAKQRHSLTEAGFFLHFKGPGKKVEKFKPSIKPVSPLLSKLRLPNKFKSISSRDMFFTRLTFALENNVQFVKRLKKVNFTDNDT